MRIAGTATLLWIIFLTLVSGMDEEKVDLPNWLRHTNCYNTALPFAPQKLVCEVKDKQMVKFLEEKNVRIPNCLWMLIKEMANLQTTWNAQLTKESPILDIQNLTYQHGGSMVPLGRVPGKKAFKLNFDSKDKENRSIMHGTITVWDFARGRLDFEVPDRDGTIAIKATWRNSELTPATGCSVSVKGRRGTLVKLLDCVTNSKCNRDHSGKYLVGFGKDMEVNELAWVPHEDVEIYGSLMIDTRIRCEKCGKPGTDCGC
jgi:hypothetical protein